MRRVPSGYTCCVMWLTYRLLHFNTAYEVNRLQDWLPLTTSRLRTNRCWLSKIDIFNLTHLIFIWLTLVESEWLLSLWTCCWTDPHVLTYWSLLTLLFRYWSVTPIIAHHKYWLLSFDIFHASSNIMSDTDRLYPAMEWEALSWEWLIHLCLPIK